VLPRALLLAALVACSAASTATVLNVAGTYSLSVADGTNGCNLANVSQGHVTQGVPLGVVQDSGTPQDMTVTVGGATGAVLTTATGTNVLTGTLGGAQATLVPALLDAGVPTVDASNCSYTTNASLLVNFAGDTVQGTLTYTLSTTGNGCGTLAACQTVQALSGVLSSPENLDASSRDDR
jgi:hypothetical protein